MQQGFLRTPATQAASGPVARRPPAPSRPLPWFVPGHVPPVPRVEPRSGHLLVPPGSQLTPSSRDCSSQPLSTLRRAEVAMAERDDDAGPTRTVWGRWSSRSNTLPTRPRTVPMIPARSVNAARVSWMPRAMRATPAIRRAPPIQRTQSVRDGPATAVTYADTVSQVKPRQPCSMPPPHLLRTFRAGDLTSTRPPKLNPGLLLVSATTLCWSVLLQSIPAPLLPCQDDDGTAVGTGPLGSSRPADDADDRRVGLLAAWCGVCWAAFERGK